MTEALKKMVEAMAAEIERQELEDEGLATPDGHLDLAKVARAGLEAIKEPMQFEAVIAAGGTCEPFQMPEGEKFTPGRIIAGECYRAMISEILKDQP